MEAYLDNSATTRCSKSAAELMVKLLTEDFGNPSSMHQKGVVAENYIKEAKSRIARTLKCQEKEIFFTSGGTESNNLAIVGAVEANGRNGKHMITTAVEHASVLEPFANLKERGYEITYLTVNSDGVISLEELKQAIRPDTVLVSIMHVNNEIGAIEPVAEAGRVIKEGNPRTLFHVDAIQSYGKMQIYPGRMNIDLLSVSGHKIHGPKGSGFLYVRDKTKIKPMINGGGQQSGIRSGTENVPAIAGLGLAAEEIYRGLEEKTKRMYELKRRFVEGASQIPGVSFNGRTDGESAPHIVSVNVENVRAEVMLHALENRGVYVSAGSACSSNKAGKSVKASASPTLRAIGLKNSGFGTTVRFSLCVDTTAEEIDYALSVMREEIPLRQKFTRH